MRRITLAAVAVAFVFVFSLSLSMQQPKQQKGEQKKAEAKKPSVPIKNEGWRIIYGDPKAKVKVEAFYPVGSGT